MKSFQHYMNLQMLELEEHKYYLSERFGYDVGEEATVNDWVNSGRAEEFSRIYAQHEPEIENFLAQNKRITKSELHKLLED